MSLDKAIQHGKEKRKPYRGEQAIDPTCRNHGGCQWCIGNRKHKFRDKHPPERNFEEDVYTMVIGVEDIEGHHAKED